MFCRSKNGTLGSSPHTRGARNSPPSRSAPGRIIPAYAGSTRTGRRSGSPPADHPRIRGEHVLCDIETPLAYWIIPAYAGSTTSADSRGRQRRDHPRIRGEHVGGLVGVWDDAGSSPHTRGALSCLTTLILTGGIIPAYAGSTATWTSTGTRRRDHPRIRGEHPSPPARLRGFPGIIPAYAGSTLIWRRRSPRRGDHPRIRGEHSRTRVVCAGGRGSSPHTRGARGAVRG